MKVVSLKKNWLRFASIILVALASTIIVEAQQPAFPTAEGAGKFVTGGRGTTSIPTTIFEVTNLSDDGLAGSLRYALTNNSPVATYRTVVFRVSGTIHLTSALKFTRANVTVAGQTAPGDGICIADFPVSFSQDNIIVRYMRFRMGDKNTLRTSPANCGVPTEPFTNPPSAACNPVNGSGGDDAFGGTYRNNIIIDHCTMSWSSDESCSIYGGTNTTLQWNMMSEPLNHSYHYETGDLNFENHGYGGIQGGASMSIHHNLYAHLQGRVPRFDGSRNLGNGATTGLENADFRNNVLYNWGIYNNNGGEGGNYNIVNNYYKYGPSTSTGSSSGVSIKYMIINPYKQSSPVLPYGKYYVDGNFVEGSSTATARNWLGAAMSGGSYADTNAAKVTTPFNFPVVTTYAPQQSYDLVLTVAGASLPKRDTLDQRIINDVKNRTGRLIDVQGGYPHATPYPSTVNAWPALASLTAPTDTDHDGMPDTWENARGLNSNLAADRNLYNANGYTNIENYLNGDSIVAKGTSNTCISSKAIVSNNTTNWIHGSDTTSSILISTDTLNLFASIKDVGNYGTFNASYYTTGTTRLLSNNKALLNRNITIVPTNPTSITAPLTVRLYFTVAEFNTLKAADPAISSLIDIRILRTNDNTCVTTLSGYPEVIVPTTSGIFGTYDDGYYVEFATANFGTFFIAGSTAVVPLKLLFINAATENKQVKISWGTTNEVNTKNFVVEKSNDAQSFMGIGIVDAKSNGAVINNYSFMDASLYQGVVYYRLKMFDKDGSYSFSPIVKVGIGGKYILSVYPNPAKDNLIVSHPKVLVGSTMQLFAADGRKMNDYHILIGSEQTLVNIESLAKGNYLLVFTKNAESIATKLVKY